MESSVCLSDQICCSIFNYEAKINGWEIQIFRAVIISLTLISVIFLMLKLRKSHHSHISVYPNFIQLASLTFLFVVVVYLLGNPFSDSFTSFFTILYFLSLAAQWWLQIAVIIFMFQPDTQLSSIKRTVVLTSGFVILMFLAPVLSFGFNCRWCGIIVTEIALTIFFAVVFIIKLAPCFGMDPRPASFTWSGFQLIAHVLFLISYSFQFLQLQEAGFCFIVISDLLYFLLYTPFLWFTLTSDSNYWKEKGALLLAFKQGKLENSQGGIVRTIPFKELELKKLVGVGGYSEVHKALWKGTTVAVKKLKIKSNEHSIELLMKEGKLLSDLQHPNIVRFIGVCVEEGNLCLITELKLLFVEVA